MQNPIWQSRKCKYITHISKHKTLNNNPKYAKTLSHNFMRWLPHTQIIICSLKNIIKISRKHETRWKNLALMKIYLFAHGTWRVIQASECKTLYKNLKKCEKNVVRCHKATFVSIQKNAKQMLHNVTKKCCESIWEGHGTVKPNIQTCMKHSNWRGPQMFCPLKMDE
jgi:hypothetical protein